MYMSLILSAALFAALIATVESDNWAVLIAGSNSYYNYRHQSDICHAYQIVTKKGIPRSNVIVFMYDDIANNSDNPFPGEIFNHPNGTNVYKGVHIDYSGDAVNKTTFLKVLKGDKSAGGPVVESNPTDDVFIYYSDHGGVGLVAMPTGDMLFADELLGALRFMHSHKMYRQLVFYLEACESGSMFEGILPANLSIFATTASNGDESSYAFYYWKPANAYLGDEYSIRWMEDSDNNWGKRESLKTQFAHVKKLVKKSHPQQYGTQSWTDEDIDDFQGDEVSRASSTPSLLTSSNAMSISQRDVKLFYLMQKYALSNGQDKAAYSDQVSIELKYRSSVETHVKEIVNLVLACANSPLNAESFMAIYQAPRNFNCLRTVIDRYSATCEPLVENGLRFVKNLVQLCETFPQQYIIQAVEMVCA